VQEFTFVLAVRPLYAADAQFYGREILCVVEQRHREVSVSKWIINRYKYQCFHFLYKLPTFTKYNPD